MREKIKETYILLLLAKNLRRFRTEKHMSQEKLAELSNLHPTYISEIERAKRNIGLEAVYKLAKALDMSVSTLLSEDDAKEIRNV